MEACLKLFANQHKKTGVLSFSLTVFTIMCMIILFFSQQFERILTFSIFLDCFGMILSGATIFWFRKKTKHLDNTGIYKMKLFPLAPIIFIASYVFVGGSIIVNYKQNNYAAAIGVSVLALFIVIYFLLHKKNKNHVE